MGLKAENNATDDERFDPDIEKALTMLGLCAKAADVSSTVTGTTSVDQEDTPDPYASEDPQQLVRRQEPKAKIVYIDGKKWLDITEIVGNSEEIIALHTVPEKKRKSKNKPLPRNASGALSRADR